MLFRSRLCSKPLVAPSLRTLCLRGAGLSRDLLASLARCTFPELDAMELWAGDLEYGWGGAATDFRELLELRRLPRLRHLAVMTDVADALIPVLAESSVLPALETLDLSCGAATDQGAHRLVENWRRFSHLTRMNLSGNFVTPAARNALMEVGSRVIVFGWQRWFDGGATLSMPPIVSLFKDWPEE